MINSTHPENSNNRICPRRVRELYAALATAPDEKRLRIIGIHWDTPTKQELLKKIESVETELRFPANDNIKAERTGAPHE